MRSFNEGWALRDTLPALQAQDDKDRELIVIDSGSTDGSVELIRAARPQHFIQIAPHEYNPSRVMNHGMQLARSEFGVFLNADATPQSSHWLRRLVTALLDPRLRRRSAGRSLDPGCQAVYVHDYERCFGENRESARWDHFFSMASSGSGRTSGDSAVSTNACSIPRRRIHALVPGPRLLHRIRSGAIGRHAFA